MTGTNDRTLCDFLQERAYGCGYRALIGHIPSRLGMEYLYFMQNVVIKYQVLFRVFASLEIPLFFP